MGLQFIGWRDAGLRDVLLRDARYAETSCKCIAHLTSHIAKHHIPHREAHIAKPTSRSHPASEKFALFSCQNRRRFAIIVCAPRK